MHGVGAEIGETIKWSSPFFEYRGRPLAMMAGFNAHAAFGFWRGGEAAAASASDRAMGQFGRLRRIGDLPPPDGLAKQVREAMERIDAGPQPRLPKPTKPVVDMPAELVAGLAANAGAAAFWGSLPPSARRDYAGWIDGVKRPETRARRIETALAQLGEGKRLNWKYGG